MSNVRGFSRRKFSSKYMFGIVDSGATPWPRIRPLLDFLLCWELGDVPRGVEAAECDLSTDLNCVVSSSVFLRLSREFLSSLFSFALWNTSYKEPTWARYGWNTLESTWGTLVKVTGGISREDGGL